MQQLHPLRQRTKYREYCSGSDSSLLGGLAGPQLLGPAHVPPSLDYLEIPGTACSSRFAASQLPHRLAPSPVVDVKSRNAVHQLPARILKHSATVRTDVRQTLKVELYLDLR